jgi:hypothetical protein
MSVIEWIPFRGSKFSVIRLSAKPKRWKWASMKPGKIVLPLQSTNIVFLFLRSTMLSLLEIAEILPSWMATSRAFGNAGSMVMTFALNRIRSDKIAPFQFNKPM